MGLEIVHTKDGSKTVFSKVFDASYHSWYGAVTENKHVFIENGLAYKHMQGNSTIKILEIGYGTGLNAILSGVYALENDVEVIYSGIDKYEFPRELLDQLNYSTFFDASFGTIITGTFLFLVVAYMIRFYTVARQPVENIYNKLPQNLFNASASTTSMCFHTQLGRILAL